MKNSAMKHEIKSSVWALVLLFPSFFPLSAHPGIGIVRDSKGNIFFTDLKHVWKLAPNGTKSIAVRNVHTHELFIDANDNLFGEHLWYEGDATKMWGHRVWKLEPNGTLTDIILSRRGFRDDYQDFFFVRDNYGAMYWADQGDTTAIRKRAQNGRTTSVARAAFRDVRWMTATPEGTIYLTDLYDLVRIFPNGTITTIASDLADWSIVRLAGPDRHAVMGLWTDTNDNVFAAIFSDRVVKKISPDGHTSVFARSEFSWAPTGGLVAPNGDVWILEYAGSSARVRWIQKDGTSTTF